VVAVADLVFAVKLGILADARAGREELVAAVEGRQIATTLVSLTLASLASATLTTLALSLFADMPCSTRLLGEHLRIGNVAIQAGNLRLHARRLIQKKCVFVVEGGHATALILHLKHLAIQRAGRTGTTSLGPLLRPTRLFGTTRLFGSP